MFRVASYFLICLFEVSPYLELSSSSCSCKGQAWVGHYLLSLWFCHWDYHSWLFIACYWPGLLLLVESVLGYWSHINDLQVLRDRAHSDVNGVIHVLIKIVYLLYKSQNPSCHKNVPTVILIWILEANNGFKLLQLVNSVCLTVLLWICFA